MHFAVGLILQCSTIQMVNEAKHANVELQMRKLFAPHVRLLPSVWNMPFRFANHMVFGAALVKKSEKFCIVALIETPAQVNRFSIS
jgi:hypothetical protein